MEYLAGTPLMEKLQKTRLIIVYYPNDKKAEQEELGLPYCEGLYYIRYLQGREDTLEILFEEQRDLDMVEQKLTQFKLGQD